MDFSLKGIIIYPKLNLCDRAEAERVVAKNIQLIGLNYPLHGSFLPFMSRARDSKKLKVMIEKIYKNAKSDQDLNVTIPESAQELFDLVSAINVPTIEELCQAIFFQINCKEEINNFYKVRKLGFV